MWNFRTIQRHGALGGRRDRHAQHLQLVSQPGVQRPVICILRWLVGQRPLCAHSCKLRGWVSSLNLKVSPYKNDTVDQNSWINHCASARAVASEVEVLIGTWPRAHLNFTEVDELNTLTALRRKVRRVILHPKYASVGIGKICQENYMRIPT